MSIYTVTFCTMDQDVGANPFWHTCILLSHFDDRTKKLEVVDNWGFYGLPTTSPDSILRKLKLKLSLDVDLYGNHGILRHEEMRYLDAGHGLHGVTFELTAEKFHELQTKCKKMEVEQKQAIDEIVKPLELPPKPENKVRIYPYEDLSVHIFALEEARAKAKGRPSRLQPFELSVSRDAHTCKSQVLSLLDGILTSKQITRLAGSHRAISRLSGKMEKIYLHSSGSTREHKKHSGEVVHYRVAEDKDVKLHWTIPPQEIETLSNDTRNLFKIHEDYCGEVQKLVRQLQLLEWLFRNATLPEQYEDYRHLLITSIQTHYEVFSKIESKVFAVNSWRNSKLWLFSQPRDQNEKLLMTNINSAKEFINDLYMAMTDKWEINLESEICLEALVVYLPVDKQKELCKIIGRNYITPEASIEGSKVDSAEPDDREKIRAYLV